MVSHCFFISLWKFSDSYLSPTLLQTAYQNKFESFQLPFPTAVPLSYIEQVLSHRWQLVDSGSPNCCALVL